MSAAQTDRDAERVQASSGITPESIEKTLKERLNATRIDIQDMSGQYQEIWIRTMNLYANLR